MHYDLYFGPHEPAVSPLRRRPRRGLSSAELSRDEAQFGQLWNLEAGQRPKRKGVTIERNAPAFKEAERSA
jgi:hypothetical protein